MNQELPAWMNSEDAELLHFALTAEEASMFGLSGEATRTLNDSLAHEQKMWEKSYADTLDKYSRDERFALQVMFTSAFKRGLTIGDRIHLMNQTEGEL